jgi:hypothetical protein
MTQESVQSRIFSLLVAMLAAPDRPSATKKGAASAGFRAFAGGNPILQDTGLWETEQPAGRIFFAAEEWYGSRSELGPSSMTTLKHARQDSNLQPAVWKYRLAVPACCKRGNFPRFTAICVYELPWSGQKVLVQGAVCGTVCPPVNLT